jgi:hypothetical protein
LLSLSLRLYLFVGQAVGWMNTEEHSVGPLLLLPILLESASSQLDISGATSQAIDYIEINFVYLRGNVHAMICSLLSSRYGLSPRRRGSRGGDVAITSPFFCLFAL